MLQSLPLVIFRCVPEKNTLEGESTEVKTVKPSKTLCVEQKKKGRREMTAALVLSLVFSETHPINHCRIFVLRMEENKV